MTIDYDRELLWATSTRHLADLPIPVSNAISAAIDELIDPLTLPALLDVDETDTDDVHAVITAVRGRLITAAGTAATVGEALAYARAARELADALKALNAGPTGT